jgi:hypothetical protein
MKSRSEEKSSVEARRDSEGPSSAKAGETPADERMRPAPFND